MFQRLFLDHPRTVNESYAEHAAVASRFGFAMIAGGLGCLVHAVVPAWCVRTGSSTVKRLYGEMAARQPNLPEPHRAAEWQIEYEI